MKAGERLFQPADLNCVCGHGSGSLSWCDEACWSRCDDVLAGRDRLPSLRAAPRAAARARAGSSASRLRSTRGCRHERAEPLPAVDDALALQLFVGALDGDDADDQVFGQAAKGGQRGARRQAAFADLALQSVDDLLVERAGLRRRDRREHEFPRTDRPCVYCIYRIYTEVKCPLRRHVSSVCGPNDEGVETRRAARAGRDDGRLRPGQQAFRRPRAGGGAASVVPRRYRAARVRREHRRVSQLRPQLVAGGAARRVHDRHGPDSLRDGRGGDQVPPLRVPRSSAWRSTSRAAPRTWSTA